MSSATWRPFCLGLNVLTHSPSVQKLHFLYEVVRTSIKCCWSIYRTSSKCRCGICRTSRKRRGTLWVVHNTHSPTLGKIQLQLFGNYVQNVHFDRFNRCSCTGKHFQSDLDIFRFDFMLLTEPHDVPSTFCFSLHTDMIFLLQQLLTPNFLQRLPSGERS